MGYFQPMVIYRDPKTNKKNSILRYIGNRVLRNNRNFLCLSGDTVLYGHDKSLKELYDEGIRYIDTTSITKPKFKHGGYYPINSKSEIFYSGKKEVYEIELENGKKIYATSEHKLFKKVGHTFNECEVKDFLIGDELRDFDVEWIDEYYNKKRKHSSNKISRSYNHFNKCDNCNSLIYVSRYRGCKTRKYCKSCREEMNDHYQLPKNYPNHWYEWEDNLLRNLYINERKDKILSLLPSRSWSSIIHRSIRLGIANGRRRIYNFSRTKMTSIEKKVALFLDSKNINYEFNKGVRNDKKFFFPDFTINKLIIECDGTYWHKGRELQDKNRQDDLEILGYEVIRFTEDQINKKFKEVKQCILLKLNL